MTKNELYAENMSYPIFHQSPYIYYSVLRKSFFFFGKCAFNTPTC